MRTLQLSTVRDGLFAYGAPSTAVVLTANVASQGELLSENTQAACTTVLLGTAVALTAAELVRQSTGRPPAPHPLGMVVLPARQTAPIASVVAGTMVITSQAVVAVRLAQSVGLHSFVSAEELGNLLYGQSGAGAFVHLGLLAGGLGCMAYQALVA